jgi:competence protein ComEC
LLILRREAPAALLLLLAIGSLGLQRAGVPALPSDHVALLTLPSPVRIEGFLTSEPTRWAPERTRLLIQAEAFYEGTERRSAQGPIQVTVYGDLADLTVGQRIAGEFRLHRPWGFRNPGGFDYPAYLARDGIFVVGSGRAEGLAPLAPEDPPWPVRIKRWALGRIHQHLPPGSAALLAGLLLGERTELPTAVNDAFRTAGVYHILAVSGFNVALLASAVFLGLSLLRVPRRLVAAVAIGCLIAFALVVGGRPSVVRATIMGVLLLVGFFLDREVNPINSLALAGLVILLWRPQDLWDPGFQLSFLATLGILVLTPPASRFLAEHRWPRWLAIAGAVSLGAQLAVTPIMLTHFNQLSLIGIAANLVVVPLAALATTLGLGALLLTLISEALAHLLFESLWILLVTLRGTVWLLAKLPVAMVHLPAPHWTASVAFYATLSVLPFLRRHWTFRFASGLLLAWIGALSLWPWVKPADGRLRVTVLDVGQGDAAFVELPDGRKLLIDGGGGGGPRLDVGERVVAPFLWNRAVNTLDVVAMSHSDPDHAGGLVSILRHFRVKEFWESGVWGDESQLPSILDRRGVVRRQLRRGERFWLGPALLRVLHPPEGLLQGSLRGPASDENNNSLVLRLDWGLTSFLFTGDLEQEGEASLLDSSQPLQHLVLKVGHHGSRYSTTEKFLAAIQPTVGVISVGTRNPFRHPTPEVLERLRAAGVRSFRTDRDGAVIIDTDGRTLTVTSWASQKTERLDLDPER